MYIRGIMLIIIVFLVSCNEDVNPKDYGKLYIEITNNNDHKIYVMTDFKIRNKYIGDKKIYLLTPIPYMLMSSSKHISSQEVVELKSYDKYKFDIKLSEELTNKRIFSKLEKSLQEDQLIEFEQYDEYEVVFIVFYTNNDISSLNNSEYMKLLRDTSICIKGYFLDGILKFDTSNKVDWNNEILDAF